MSRLQALINILLGAIIFASNVLLANAVFLGFGFIPISQSLERITILEISLAFLVIGTGATTAIVVAGTKNDKLSGYFLTVLLALGMSLLALSMYTDIPSVLDVYRNLTMQPISF